MAEKKKKPPPTYQRVFREELGNVNRYRAALRKMIAAQEMGEGVDVTEAKESLEYNKGILHKAFEDVLEKQRGGKEGYIRVIQEFGRNNFWMLVEKNLIGGDAELPIE